jgi:hypothetical protein
MSSAAVFLHLYWGEAARALGQQIHILHAGSEAELEVAFATARQVAGSTSPTTLKTASSSASRIS